MLDVRMWFQVRSLDVIYCVANFNVQGIRSKQRGKKYTYTLSYVIFPLMLILYHSGIKKSNFGKKTMELGFWFRKTMKLKN